MTETLPPGATETLGSELSLWRNFGGVDPTTGDWYDWQSEWQARDIAEMLRRDGYARQVENVITWPLMSVLPAVIKPAQGDRGEYEQITESLGRMATPLDSVLAEGIQSLIFRAAFHEPIWSVQHGVNEYERLAWRPPDSCTITRNKDTGALTGFNQTVTGKSQPVPLRFERAKAVVWQHGKHRDPIRGTSEMEVAYRCYRDKQKIRALWFFVYLEGVAIPRVIGEAPSGQEDQLVKTLVKLKNAGVAAVPPGTNATTLDVSGKGAGQFKEAIDFLNMEMAASVLAAFLNLTSSPGTVGRGSYALSKSATDFFTQSMDGNAHELELTTRDQVIRPLCRFNFGPDAAVPLVQIGPISGVDAESLIQLLQQLASGPGGAQLPAVFLDELVQRAAGMLDLDVDKITAAIKSRTETAASSPAAAPSAPVHATAEVLSRAASEAASGGGPLLKALAS